MLLFGRRNGSSLALDDVQTIPNRTIVPTQFRVDVGDITNPDVVRGRSLQALFHSHPLSLRASSSDIRSIHQSDLLWIVGVLATEGLIRLRAYSSTKGRVQVVPIKVEVTDEPIDSRI